MRIFKKIFNRSKPPRKVSDNEVATRLRITYDWLLSCTTIQQVRNVLEFRYKILHSTRNSTNSFHSDHPAYNLYIGQNKQAFQHLYDRLPQPDREKLFISLHRYIPMH